MNKDKALQMCLEYIETDDEKDAHERKYVRLAIKQALSAPVQEPVSMRMPKVGDKVVCIEDESLGTVVYLTAGGSPEIKFDDGSHGTYMLREFAELFGYTTPPAAQPAPVKVWEAEGYDSLMQEMQMVKARNIRQDAEIERLKAAQPAVPDAFGTREGEHPQYIQGWNDCRAEMLKGMKP